MASIIQHNSHTFSPKIGGFHEITWFNQEAGVVVTQNLRINFGHLFIEEILENQKLGQAYCLYPIFLQIY